jgi:hypothetical protein
MPIPARNINFMGLFFATEGLLQRKSRRIRSIIICSSFICNRLLWTNKAKFLPIFLEAGSASTTLVHPGGLFSTYSTYIFQDAGNKHYYSMNTTGEIPSTFVKLEAYPTIVSKNLDNMEVNFTGKFDMFSCTYSFGTKMTLFVQSPSSTSKFVLPEFGEAIGEKDFRLKDFGIQYVELIDYEGYEDEPKYFKLFNDMIYPDISQYKQKLSLTIRLTD